MHTIRVRKAKTFWQKSSGLIGAKQAYPLHISTRFGIHTFGLSFPIDVVILDTTFHVVRLKKKLLPNRVFFWPPVFSTLVELPQGSIEKRQIRKGDVVRLLYD